MLYNTRPKKKGLLCNIGNFELNGFLLLPNFYLTARVNLWRKFILNDGDINGGECEFTMFNCLRRVNTVLWHKNCDSDDILCLLFICFYFYMFRMYR